MPVRNYGEDWIALIRRTGGYPPIEIGRPQKEFIRSIRRREITGSVLDIGCGTVENAPFIAGEGHEVWGIGSSPRAIQKATEKAVKRGIGVQFLILNALNLTGINRKCDTVTDSGFFHTLSDDERPYFIDNLAATLSSRREIFHALLLRTGTRRVWSREDTTKRDTGELQGLGVH